jgi:manganese/zinc/iron transport system permease protein
MLLLGGAIGLVAAVAGVIVSAARPGLATGPLVVLAAAVVFLVSFVAAPSRGWMSRRLQRARLARGWDPSADVSSPRGSEG